MIIPTFRSIWRIYRGLRPSPSDLDKIITGLQNRQTRKKPSNSKSWINYLPRSSPEKQSERLRRFQLRKLQNTVEYMYKYIPYYQEQMDHMNVTPSEIQSLEDICKLPITRRSILQTRHDDFLSRKPGLNPIQLFKTSGTIGEPLVIYLTAVELNYLVAGRAIGGLLTGSQGPSVIFQLHFPFDTCTDAVVATRAAQMAGSLVLNYGSSGTVEYHVKSLFKDWNIPGKDKKVSIIFCSPAYLWTLTRKAEEMGLDFNQSGLKWIETGGAMVTEALKQRVRETWGIELSEGFGMVETTLHAAGRCPEGRMHFIDLTGFIEVLNPKTQEPVQPGEEGVLVKTEFYPEKETMPLLRYWTQDLVTAGSNEICPCGIPTSYILDILGRADQTVIVGGLNCYPQEVGDSLLGIPDLNSPPRFHISVTETISGQEVTIDVESVSQLDESTKDDLRKTITQKISFADYRLVKSGAIQLKVNILPPDSIAEPFRYKHRFPSQS